MKRFPLSFLLIGALSALALALTLGGLPLAQAGPDQDNPPTQTALAPTLIATGGPTPTEVGDGRPQRFVWVSRQPATTVPYNDDSVTEFPDGTTLIYINVWVRNEPLPVDYQIETYNGFGALQSPRLEGRYDPAWGIITIPWTPGSGSIPRAGNDYVTKLILLKNIAGTIVRIPYQVTWRIGSNMRFNQSSYSGEGPASLEVIDDGRNQNPNSQETVTVRVWSDNGDPTGFTITLKESSPNSGRFVTGASVGQPNLSFCTDASCTDAASTRLAVNPNGDRVRASYRTASNLDLTAQADWVPTGGGGGTPRPPTPTGPPTATPTRTPTLPGGAIAVTLTPVPTTLAPGVYVPRVGYIRGVRNRSGLPPINFPDFNPDMSVGYYDASTEPVWVGFIQFDYTWPTNAQLVNADLTITGSRGFNPELKGDTGQWRVDVISMGDQVIDYTMVFTDIAGADTLATLSPVLTPDMLQPQVANRLFFGPEARQAVQSQLESQRRVVFRITGPASVSFREQNIFSWATGWAGAAPSSEPGPQLRLNYLVQLPTGTATATSAVSATATPSVTASRTGTPPPATSTRTPSVTASPTASAPAPPTTATPTPSPTPPTLTLSPSPTGTPALPSFVVTGLVEDCARTRLTNARVSILQTGYSALTQEGIYVMPSVSLPDAVYTLLAVKGDLVAARQATLSPGQGQFVVNFTDEFCLRSAASATPTATGRPPTLTPTLTATPTPTLTETPTPEPTETPASPKTPSVTPTPEPPDATETAAPSPSATATALPPTASPSVTASATRTASPSATVTPSASPTATWTVTTTASATPTLTPTATASPTATLTPTPTLTATATASPTPTITPTRVTNVYLDKAVYATYADRVRITVFDLGRYASGPNTAFSAPIEVYSDASAARIRLNLYRDDTVPGQYIPDINSLVGFCEECNETDVVNLQLKVRSGSIIRVDYRSLDGTLYTATARWQLNPLPTVTLTPTTTLSPTASATRTVTRTATATEPAPTLTAAPTLTPTLTSAPATVTPTPSASPTATPSAPAATATPTGTAAFAPPTPTPTAQPISVTASPTATGTPSGPVALTRKVYLPLIIGGDSPSAPRGQPAADRRPGLDRLADALSGARRLWMALNSLSPRK